MQKSGGCPLFDACGIGLSDNKDFSTKPGGTQGYGLRVSQGESGVNKELNYERSQKYSSNWQLVKSKKWKRLYS
jgi:hypothetical protein